MVSLIFALSYGFTPCNENLFPEVNAPIAILGAEIDKMSPPELVKQFEEILSSKPEVHETMKGNALN